jgi:hypothetical protein
MHACHWLMNGVGFKLVHKRTAEVLIHAAQAYTQVGFVIHYQAMGNSSCCNSFVVCRLMRHCMSAYAVILLWYVCLCVTAFDGYFSNVEYGFTRIFLTSKGLLCEKTNNILTCWFKVILSYQI